MDIDSSIIETGFDRLVGLVREKGKISEDDAAKQLKVSTEVIHGWAESLAEDGTIKIEFRLTKIYLVDSKTYDRDSYSLLAKEFGEFIKSIIGQIADESLKKKFASSFAEFKKTTSNSEKQTDRFFNSAAKFLAPLAEETKNQIGYGQTEKIFERAYSKVRENCEDNSAAEQILIAVPRGILEVERFNILTKEEIKKVAIELKRIEVMKSDFTNIAAHELRTPLVPIIGFLDRLLKQPDKFKLTKEVQENLGICLRNAKKLNLMVEDMLSISKLESGAMKFDMKSVDLRKIIKNVKSDMVSSAKKKKLELKVKMPDKLPKIIGDERRLAQVLSNLVQNAVKFSDKGIITISATQKGGKILCRVKDQGVGIGKDEIPKLFDKYYQVAASAREQMGTGLGLSICKEIIQKHKGSIGAESELGKGSSFYFTLPVINRKK